MCYAYIRQQSDVREDHAEGKENMSRETGVPLAEPVTARESQEDRAYAGFLERIQRMLAAAKQKREETAS